jgi:putative colanic acid biosysnthesis UDP-glucose lipid carrier transferase
MKYHFMEKDYYVIRVFSDFAVLILSYYLTSILSHRNEFAHDREILLLLVISWYFSSRWINIYDDFRTLRFIDELLLLLPVIVVQALIVIIGFFFTDDHLHARKFVFEYCGWLLGLLIIKKYLSKKVFQYLRKLGNNERKVLIIGSNDIGMSFFDFLNSNSQFGYKVVGFIDSTKNAQLNGLYKGKIEEIERIICESHADEIIIALPDFNKSELDFIVGIGEKKAIRTRIIPDYFKFNSSKYKMEMFGSFPMVTVRDEPMNQSHFRFLKRLVDIVISIFICIFIFSWLFPIVAILIKIDSEGDVFYIQERWGRNNKHFKFFKFRTMRVDSQLVVKGKFQQTTENDPRITKIGGFLRKTSIDELPQFLNVLMGNMSVVGPRPHAVPHNEESQELINNYSIRHWVKPGITGWAQVNGLRGETKDFNLMRKRVEFDIWYIENWSVWLDMKIFSMTIYDMVKGDMMAY